MSYIDDIELDGFAVFPDLIGAETIHFLLQELATAIINEAVTQRAGTAYGIRDLLNVVPAARALANSAALRSLIEPILGSTARVIRGVYFDKHKDANWMVAWHQDLTIAVRKKVDVDGYGPWSVKAGIHHVQPPLSVLRNMLTLRIHLDHTDESDGALRVIPGTHKYGRLGTLDVQYWKEHQRMVVCPVKKGGVMVMRPLLLHSSLAAANPKHRRVLHFEYSSIDLAHELSWFEEFPAVA